MDAARWSEWQADWVEKGGAARLAAPGPDRAAQICTQRLDLREYARVALWISASPMPGQAGAALLIECSDRDGHWLPVGVLSGPSLRGVLPLPAGGMHERVQVRLRVAADAGAAGWLVDEIWLEARCILLIEPDPRAAATLSVTIGEAAEACSSSRLLDVPLGADVRVDAPLRAGQHVFGRWLSAGIPADAFAADAASIAFVPRKNARLTAQYDRLGDLNNDEQTDKLDIDPFVLALLDLGEYQRRFPGVNALRRGDANADGLLDSRDIEPFVDALLGAPAPR